MKKYTQVITGLCSVLALLTFAGQAHSEAMGDIKLDVQASKHASVQHVKVTKNESGLIVKGKLKNKHIGRNQHLRGNVEISLIAADGSILSTKRTPIQKASSLSMHRRNMNSRYADFSYEFKELPVNVSSIRIKHIK